MAVTRTLRFTILARDGFECVYCHAKDKPLEVDHVRPKALGGTDAPENLVAACDQCNGGKAASHLAELDSVPRPNLLHNSVLIAALNQELAAEREKSSREKHSLRLEAVRYRRRLREVEVERDELAAELKACARTLEVEADCRQMELQIEKLAVRN